MRDVNRFGNRWQQNGPQTFLATFTGNNQSNPQNNNRMDGYSYDAAGNLLNDGIHSYTYDAENRLIQVDNGNTATYVYDADGNRVQKTQASGNVGDPAGTWQFLYDQFGRMIQRYDGNFWQGNFYAGPRLLATLDAWTNLVHSDWLGTMRVTRQLNAPMTEGDDGGRRGTDGKIPFLWTEGDDGGGRTEGDRREDSLSLKPPIIPIIFPFRLASTETIRPP